MIVATGLGILFALFGICHAAYTDKDFLRMESTLARMERALNTSQAKIARLEKEAMALKQTAVAYKTQIVALSRQVSHQQFYVEETARTGGDSGLKVTRGNRVGSKSYFSNGFSGTSVAAIHDHSNYKNVVGMGELCVVLNGVEFRTRHNDYKLAMPHRKDTTFGETETVPYPDVPPEVLAQPTVALQIKEMREWFKAWKNSDHSKRDFRKYFKPNLCYMEGMWTIADSGTIDEPFDSDRHSLEANSFFELLENIKFASSTGRKNKKENYAFLPTTISKVDENGNVQYAQWNYKILCHPLKRNVLLNRFRLEDDLANRVSYGRTLDVHETSRAARFALYDDTSDPRYFKKKDQFSNSVTGSFLETLMNEIPGKDNYRANIVDDTFDEIAYTMTSKFTEDNASFPLNAGYYHRKFKVDSRDAMGVTTFYRGFFDSSLYVAYNTRSKIMPSETQKCERKVCKPVSVRVSYAIPLEIVYLTPLQTWNPYNVVVSDTGKKRFDQVRNGGLTRETAFDGASSFNYYLTPAEFFDDENFKRADPADTAKSSTGVLDSKGVVRQMVASGVSIFTRNIPGVGSMRLRYPIMPIHQAGSVIYKELEALKDMTLLPHKYAVLYPESKMNNGTIEMSYSFEMNPSTKTPPGLHTHTVTITEDEIRELKNGKTFSFTSSNDNGHQHEVKVSYNSKRSRLEISQCDGTQKICWDGHSGSLTCSDCRFDIGL